jgi:hypothetical protein
VTNRNTPYLFRVQVTVGRQSKLSDEDEASRRKTAGPRTVLTHQQAGVDQAGSRAEAWSATIEKRKFTQQHLDKRSARADIGREKWPREW